MHPLHNFGWFNPQDDLIPTARPEVAELVEVLRRIPPKAPKIFSLEEDNTIECMCGVKRLKANMELKDSGIVKFRSKLCRGCRNVDAKWCPIVCASCGDVVAYKEPDVKDPVDGFVFTPGQVYHTARCLNCDPASEMTFIIERKIWQQKNPPIPTHSTPT